MLTCDVRFFSSRRRHTSCSRDWSSDVCSSDLVYGCSAKLGCRILQQSRPILDVLKLLRRVFFENSFYLRECFFGLFQSFWDETAVFYFVNHSWQKLPVVNVALVILYS